MSTRHKSLFALLATSGFIAISATLLLLISNAHANEIIEVAVVAPEVMQWGFLAAALATGLSSLGAGIAVAGVGSAAVGALTEKPDLLGRALIMVGLAEGIAIYGLIISILILNKII